VCRYGVKKSWYRFLAVTSLLLVIAMNVNCSEPLDDHNYAVSEQQFSGFITAINPDTDGGVIGTLIVESHADEIVRRLRVVITDTTLILKEEGGGRHVISFDGLQLTDRVKVWLDKPIAGSSDTAEKASRLIIEQPQ
jgi:hypothetical protein